VVQVLADPGRVSVSEAPDLQAVDVVSSAGLVAPFRLHGYDVLLRALGSRLGGGGLRVDVAVRGRDPVPGADVVVVPYDFRWGVRAAAEVVQAEVGRRLAGLAERERAGRLVVVGHSMGGLVARRWLAAPGQARLCRVLLTVGTPHRGASKALDWLVNGAAVGRGLVRAASAAVLAGMTEVLREWPAVYDLLPTYQAVQAEDGATLAVGQLPGRLAGFAAETAFADGVSAAGRVHEEITAGWAALEAEARPVVVPFLAFDHGTPHAAFLARGRLVVRREDPDWQPNDGWRGDGTVPAISAVPPEMAGSQELWHPLRDRHSPMSGAEGVVQLVRSLVGDSLDGVRGYPVEGLRLGVDLDDAAVVGQPVTVGARLEGEPEATTAASASSRVGVWLFVQPADGSADAARLPMQGVPGGWSCVWTPPEPGSWRVTVQAVGVEGAGRLAVEDTVGVVDLDEPARRRGLAGGSGISWAGVGR
jgi:hypothetical protein